jgi:PAS domain S-box-containing protein
MFFMATIVAFEVSQLRQALGWVDHTDAVISEARTTLRRIVDIETGLRGYLITGNQEFLASDRHLSNLESEFSKLENMVADNPVQRKRLMDIHAKYLNWLDYSKQMIRLRETQGDYANFQRNLEGKHLMDDIRADFSTAISVEQQLRDSRIQKANDLDSEFKWSLAALCLALTAALVLFSRYQLRNLARQYDSALRTTKEQAALERERKQWFQTLLRSVGDAVIATDAQGQITFMNPSAEAATGWSEAEARTLPLDKVFLIVNEHTRQTVENPVYKIRRLNTVVGLANHTVLIRKDGREINIDDSGAPIHDDLGNMVGIILIFRDITRQYEMERSLRTAEKLALAGRITARVAHEIYNPLDTVANLLHLIRMDAAAPNSAEYAELACQELRRVNQVTRSMLNLYRESETPVPVPLEEILDGALSLLDTQIKTKEARITRNLLPDAVVEGFPAELRQVFTNLIHNALDAIPQGGHIGIECTSVDTQNICITVSDNGSGISPEDMPRLFQPLFTTKGQNGTGLGLWLSKGIIEKHGGAISVKADSNSGASGTAFSVILSRRFPAHTVNGQSLAA